MLNKTVVSYLGIVSLMILLSRSMILFYGLRFSMEPYLKTIYLRKFAISIIIVIIIAIALILSAFTI